MIIVLNFDLSIWWDFSDESESPHYLAGSGGGGDGSSGWDDAVRVGTVGTAAGTRGFTTAAIWWDVLPLLGGMFEKE